jgi:2-aminoethylphosphonate transport system ATP-binding protein
MSAAPLSFGRTRGGRAAAVATAASGNRIAFEDVTIAYGGLVIVDKLNLEIRPGEILALIGPSGSGKTTVLRALAGFTRPRTGRMRIGDVDVTDMPPHARDIGLVVQNYALFPHMRVGENVAFGLRARGAPRELIEARVPECLRMVGMLDFVERDPRQLSGGQQQRVAIARALAISPRVLLLDEPLSALDAQIRRSMVDEIAKLHQKMPNLTILYVTHDQNEALTLADRIAIMRQGRVSALAASNMLYRKPPNRFAAEFLGRANLLDVEVIEPGSPDTLARVRFGSTILQAEADPAIMAGAACLLCIRPHDIALTRDEAHTNAISAVLESVQWQGDSHVLALRADDVPVRVVSTPLRRTPQPGATLELFFAAEDAKLILDDASSRD